MAEVKKLERLTVDEYLAGELSSQVRHELVGGQLYAMVGASSIHNLIALSMAANLRAHLSQIQSLCHVYMSDMKVRVGDHFFYPDLVVSCVPTVGKFYFITEPRIVIEVLSPTTERQDRLEKWLGYQSLSSLQEYVLIAQDLPQVEIFRRVQNDWQVEVCGLSDNLQLHSVNLKLRLKICIKT